MRFRLLLSYKFEKGAVDARIFAELGMEGCCHHSSLPDGYRIRSFGGNDFDAGADALDLGGADEDHLERGVRVNRIAGDATVSGREKLALADGAVDLTSVGIAADAYVEGAQAGLPGIFHFGGEQDCSGAGAECGLGMHELIQFFESFLAEKFEEGAGFATRDDEAVDLVELLRLFDEHNFGAQLLEPAAVGIEIALQGQDTDLGSTYHFGS